MATAPFPGLSSVDTNLTGNSVFAVDQNGILWMVAEDSIAGGAAIFSSSDQGITFAQVAAVPNTLSSNLSFDPAIALDATGNLHFIGQVQTVSNGIQIVKYTWTPATSTLTGPFTLDTDGLFGADYDIVALTNGHCYVVSCLITDTVETILGMEIDATGVIVTTDTLVSQAFAAGNRFGSVTLYSPDGVAVEIYLGSHPKIVTFKDMAVTLSLVVRSGADALAAPVTLTTFQARHVDNRLTVIGDGAARYLSQCYYTQAKLQLAGNILLGTLSTGGGAWSFFLLAGTPTASFVEPTLSVSSGGLVLGYITKDFTVFPAVDSPVSIVSVAPATFTLTPRTDFPYLATDTFLRGSKSVLPAIMPWGFLAQRVGDQTSRFYTGYNSPPIVTLSPNVLTGHRGTTYDFDASESFSPNLNPLVFTWSHTDPTEQAVFVVNGEQAALMLPKSVGAAPETLSVTVSVVSTDALGNPLHPAVTQTCVVTYPLVNPPVITPSDPIPVDRNSNVEFTPTVTDSDDDTVTFVWQQTSGTTVEMLSDANDESLVFTTNGALTGGENLVFQLTVNDGITNPVVGTFTFVVAARAVDPETKVLNRATFAGNISQRNTALTWSAPVATDLVTEFLTAKRTSIIGGGSIYLLVGPKSVVVQLGIDEEELVSYHVLLPDTTGTILDAVHSDFNATVVLTADGLLQQFVPSPALVDTDNATSTLALSTVTQKSYIQMQITPGFGGNRVIVLSGAAGVLLLEVNTQTLVVISFLELSMESGFLYGADQVDFVRISDVESVRSGEVLVGTVDANGNTFETRIDLTTRSILSTLDSATLINPTVTTGELLFQPNDSYAGQPLPPVLASPVVVPTGVALRWTQSRPDLVQSYRIFNSTDGTNFSILSIVSSGLAAAIVISGLKAGQTYFFEVQAISLDGPSPVSNIVQISL